MFHSLRSTFNVQLALAGVPIVVASQLMDHTSIETTREYYSHVGVSDTAAIMQLMPGIDEMIGTITLPGMAKLWRRLAIACPMMPDHAPSQTDTERMNTPANPAQAAVTIEKAGPCSPA